jgi:hypothetical protein
MVKTLLLVLALACLPVTGAAQHAAPELEASRRAPGVTLTLTGFVAPNTGGALTLPLPLLERLAADGALLSVDTAPASGRVVVQVRFGFATVSEFRQWYTDERTTSLLAQVQAVTLGGSFETFVSYRPATAP